MSNNLDIVSLEKMNFDEMVAEINHLIAKDFSKLVYLLYAIDVSEKKLKALLASNPQENAGKLIALMILQRQEEKRKSREQTKKPDQDIPEADRW